MRKQVQQKTTLYSCVPATYLLSNYLKCVYCSSLVVYYICFYIPVLPGFGAGLCYIAPLVVIAKYFKKKRVLATGMSSAGFSFGSFTFGLSAGYIIRALGWRHSLVVMATMNVQALVVAAWFFDHVTRKRPPHTLTVVCEETSVHKVNEAVVAPDTHIPVTEIHVQTAERCKKFCHAIAFMDVKLLRTKEFSIFAAATLPTMTGTMAFYMLGPNRAYVQGVDKVQSSFVSSAVGCCSFIGRILAGVVGNKRWICSVVHYSAAALLGGIMIALSALAGSSLPLHLTFAAMFGFCLGTLYLHFILPQFQKVN